MPKILASVGSLLEEPRSTFRGSAIQERQVAHRDLQFVHIFDGFMMNSS